MSVTAVQKHVGVLEAAGLVHKRRQGREQRVRTDISVVRAAARLLDDLEATWRDRVARMDALLAEDQPEDPDPTNTEGDT